MGQNQSMTEPHSSRNYNVCRVEQLRPIERVQHEGILKLKTTPFPNCIQIDSDGSPLFLENAQTSLQDLLHSRMYTNRLFPLEDVKKLIENIVYTLAYFQDVGVPYKDLCPYNIYYCSGKFKLLPNQLTEQSLFKRASRKYHHFKSNEEFICISPQMIIGLRYKEQQLDDLQILNKSNVFVFGMIVLEACTMLPSSQCFDESTYDIFNSLITDRLELVEEHYGSKLASIIANMIDYDYSERMLMKDVAIWINREFAQEPENYQSWQSDVSQQSKPRSHEIKSRFVQKNDSGDAERQRELEQIQFVDRNNQKTQKIQRSHSRNNIVYLNKYNDLKEEQFESDNIYEAPKNQVYMKQLQRYPNKQVNHESFNPHYHVQSYPRAKPQNNVSKNPSCTNYQKYERDQPQRVDQKHNQYNWNYKLPQRQQKQKENPYQYRIQGGLYGPTKTRPINNPYDQFNQRQQQALTEIENQQKPRRTYQHQNPYLKKNVQEEKQRNYRQYNGNSYNYRPNDSPQHIETEKKPRLIHYEVNPKRKYKANFDSYQSESRQSLNDNSINRIRMEIEKSRKLIEVFRKAEGIGKN